MPAPAPTAGPALQLVDALPGASCVRRDAAAVLEGEGVEALADALTWPRDCLPSARVRSDAELLNAAEVVLEAPAPGKRTARAVTRGVVVAVSCAPCAQRSP